MPNSRSAKIYTGTCKRVENKVTWMWSIFPKIRDLGRSDRALRFAISSRDETEAYLEHSILGATIIDCDCLARIKRHSTPERGNIFQPRHGRPGLKVNKLSLERMSSYVVDGIQRLANQGGIGWSNQARNFLALAQEDQSRPELHPK